MPGFTDSLEAFRVMRVKDQGRGVRIDLRGGKMRIEIEKREEE